MLKNEAKKLVGIIGLILLMGGFTAFLPAAINGLTFIAISFGFIAIGGLIASLFAFME